MKDLLLTFYGDDFTGSTDVMEALTLGGVPTMLFLEAPTRAFVEQHFPHLRALGVAGTSRSMTPEQMDEELPSKFSTLKELGAPLFHYKVCSTFDSAPDIGNIGRATEIGLDIFESPAVPMMIGAPALRRYMLFGNLFASIHDETYRLDRHPNMSRHPITPMKESDIRRHLAEQTQLEIGLLDVLTLAQSDEEIARKYQSLIDEVCKIILIDTLDTSHLPKIGKLVWEQRGDKPVFIVSSSGIEYALAAYWQSVDIAEQTPPLESPGQVEQLLVMSGSAAPPTALQIDWAIENGYVPIRLNTIDLIHPDKQDAEMQSVITEAIKYLQQGKNVLLYSARGSDDPSIEATRGALIELGFTKHAVGQKLGTIQGIILRQILEQTGLKRVCVTGGDTCGYVSHQLGIYALEMIVPIAPGAPLCRAYSHEQQFDRLEISLKAGQMGKANYFDSILRGSL